MSTLLERFVFDELGNLLGLEPLPSEEQFADPAEMLWDPVPFPVP